MAITLSENNAYISNLENRLRGTATEIATIVEELRESQPDLATRLEELTTIMTEDLGAFEVAGDAENTITALSILGSVSAKSVNITRWFRSEAKPTRTAFILNWEMSFGVEVYDYVHEILKDFNVDGVTLSPSAIVAITHAINVREIG